MVKDTQIGDKVDVVLNLALFALDAMSKQAILDGASHQLHRTITWEDIEDWNITLKAELSLY